MFCTGSCPRYQPFGGASAGAAGAHNHPGANTRRCPAQRSGPAFDLAISGRHSVVARATAPAEPVNATAPAPAAPLTPALDGTVLMPSSAIGSNGNRNFIAAPAVHPTAAMGAGGVANASRMVPSGAGPYTALQLAESFQRADANRDGELSRAEFQRLTIAPASFEEMDRDHNGLVTRSEYEDGTR